MNRPAQRTILSGNEAAVARKAIEAASWIWHPDAPRNQTAVVRFNIDFEATGEPLTFHISADQRFLLKLDETPLARGPDCGDPAHWPFSTYRFELAHGPHSLTVEAWWIGSHAPLARMTVEGGFILKAEGAYDRRLTTGTAPWTAVLCPEYSFQPWETEAYHAVGDQLHVDGRLRGKGAACPAAVIASAAHHPIHGLQENKWIMAPSPLPGQLAEPRTCGTVRATSEPAFQNLLDNRTPFVVPANTTLSFICDLNDYYCAYPRIQCSGGADAQVSWGWAEALFENDLKTKTDRNRVDGLHFTGMEDCFISSGGENQTFETLWWRAGRYIRLSIQTEEEPLVLQSLEIEETRYPLENAGRFCCEEAGIDELVQLCFRGLQCNSHETATDCPCYEQLMYAGDTRLQALIQYATSGDDRLVRRCIELFNGSRTSGCNGLTTSRYPDRDTQWIPTFSLIWIWMVHDYYYWRNDPAFVSEQLAGTRSVMNAFGEFLNAGHLLENVPHWVFLDWVPEWFEGYPPGGQGGISALVNLLYIQTLEKASELEAAFGSRHLAEAYREQMEFTSHAVLKAFWDDARNLMADDTAHEHFSEHGQALTILCSCFDNEIKQSALNGLSAPEPDLAKASIYFSFYIFEALLSMNETADIRTRLEAWLQLSGQGFKTPPEEFGQSRSDCHAWGSHPLFHFHASVLGIRPAAPGFRTVRIAPRNIGWKKIGGTTVHPKGEIETALVFSDGALEGEIILPPGLAGTLEWGGTSTALASGKNHIGESRP
jgi:alpha-L-rhamnosidase